MKTRPNSKRVLKTLVSQRKFFFADGSALARKCKCKNKLDGCIVWNAHNARFGSKRSAICAQAVSFLHSTRFSVTWLNSRWWLVACDWVMSALSAVSSTRVGRRRKFGEVSCTDCPAHGNDFELIPTVEMETIHPVEGYFGSEFPAIRNHCGVMVWSCKRLKFLKNLHFFRKTTPYSKTVKILFRKVSLRY